MQAKNGRINSGGFIIKRIQEKSSVKNIGTTHIFPPTLFTSYRVSTLPPQAKHQVGKIQILVPIFHVWDVLSFHIYCQEFDPMS